MKKQAKKNKRRMMQSKSDEVKCEILIRHGRCPHKNRLGLECDFNREYWDICSFVKPFEKNPELLKQANYDKWRSKRYEEMMEEAWEEAEKRVLEKYGSPSDMEDDFISEEILMKKEYGCKFGCPGCHLLRGSFQQQMCQDDKELVKMKQEAWQATKDLVKTLKTGLQEVDDLGYRIMAKDTLKMLAKQHTCQ